MWETPGLLEEMPVDKKFKSDFDRAASSRANNTKGFPGITELRAIDEEFNNRPVWARQTSALDDLDDEEASETPLGEAISKSLMFSSSVHWTCEQDKAAIRFGSFQENFIFNAMRLLVLVELVGVTFIIAFDMVYPLRRSVLIIASDLFLTSLLILGVAARFNTSFVSPRDNIEVLRKEEIKNVLLTDRTLWLDAVGLLAAPLLYCRGLIQCLALLRLLKCWRLPRTFRRSVLLQHQKLTGVTDQLAHLTVSIFVATHLYACVWFQAKVNSPPGYGHEWSAWNGWSIDVFEVEAADEGSLSIPLVFGTLDDLYFCYARAFRDGAYMLISWNGPNAISSLELIVIGILSPISGLIMAYVYALFVASIEQSRMLEKQLVERMSVLSDACRDMYLPTDLRDRILRYHSFLSMHHLGAETQDLFQQLSPNLTCEMRMFRMRNVIFSANFFEGLSDRLVLLLVQTFIEQVFAPGDMVVRKGEVADCMYIILRGSIAVLSDDFAKNCVKKMDEGCVFGEVCFVQDNMTRTAWIRAETYLVVWRFDKVNFEALLDSHEDARSQMVNHILNRVKDFIDFDTAGTLSRRVSAIVGSDEALGAQFGRPTVRQKFEQKLEAMAERAEDDSSSSSSGLSSGETTPLMSSHRSAKDTCPSRDAPVGVTSFNVFGMVKEGTLERISVSEEQGSLPFQTSKSENDAMCRSRRRAVDGAGQEAGSGTSSTPCSPMRKANHLNTAPTSSLTAFVQRASVVGRGSVFSNQGLSNLLSSQTDLGRSRTRRPSLLPLGLEEPSGLSPDTLSPDAANAISVSQSLNGASQSLYGTVSRQDSMASVGGASTMMV